MGFTEPSPRNWSGAAFRRLHVPSCLAWVCLSVCFSWAFHARRPQCRQPGWGTEVVTWPRRWPGDSGCLRQGCGKAGGWPCLQPATQAPPGAAVRDSRWRNASLRQSVFPEKVFVKQHTGSGTVGVCHTPGAPQGRPAPPCPPRLTEGAFLPGRASWTPCSLQHKKGDHAPWGSPHVLQQRLVQKPPSSWLRFNHKNCRSLSPGDRF